jgi:hypothetical protein
MLYSEKHLLNLLLIDDSGNILCAQYRGIKSNIRCTVRFEVLAVSIKIVAFWDVMPSILVEKGRSFGETCRIMFWNPDKQKIQAAFSLPSYSGILVNKRSRQRIPSYKIGRSV